MAVGVNGIRQVKNGQIITGDSTYGPGPQHIAEYTEYPELNLYIGQSYSKIDGCTIVYQNNKYALTLGNARHIRNRCDGEKVCTVVVNQAKNKATFFWYNFTDIASLPPEPLDEVIVIVKPKEPEKPKPEEPIQMVPNKIETVKRMLKLHPEVKIWDEEDRAKIIDLCCKAENPINSHIPWGRKARNKDGSNKNTDGWTFLNADNTFYIVDVLAGIDINPNKPIEQQINKDRTVYATWDVYGPFKQGENGYWAPANSIENGKPEEPKPEPPTGINLPSLNQWIKVEYPQLVKAYKSRHNGNEPDHEWAAFQTCRRGGVMLAPGEKAWSFEDMLKHELSVK